MNNNTSNIINIKKSRLRFSYNDELLLLTEFVSLNPILNPEKWEILQKHLRELTGKSFLLRTIKKHIKLLLELFLKEDIINTKKSGVEEPISERDNLLQEVADMCQGNPLLLVKCTRVVSKEKRKNELGIEARDAIAISFHAEENNSPLTSATDHSYDNNCSKALGSVVASWNIDCAEFEIAAEPSNFVYDSHELSSVAEKVDKNKETTATLVEENKFNTPTRSTLVPSRRRTTNRTRGLRTNALDYLRSKQERDNEIRMRELEHEDRKLKIEERKIALEEKKVEMELLERKQKLESDKARLELENHEKKTLNATLAYQQKLIESFIPKIV